MAQEISLLDFLLKLFGDEELRAEFAENPQQVLDEYQLSDLSAEDVHDALVLIQDNQTADFSRSYDTGGNQIHVPPPPPAPAPAPGESSHEAAVQYLNSYVTNNFIDDRDTIVDNSINQQIDTGGGDFDQDIDIDSVVASGDGAVAAGDDITDSNIVTGDGNQVGDGSAFGDGNVVGEDNQVVNGDGNTTAFGGGDANSATFDNVNVSQGGAISVGGDARGEFEVEDSFNTTTTTTTDSFNTDVDIDDSFNTDNSQTTVNDNDVNVDVDVDQPGQDPVVL